MDRTSICTAILLAMVGPAQLVYAGTSVERKVGEFDRLDLKGSYEVTVVRGANPGLRLEGDPKDIERTITEVKNGTLVVKPQKRIGSFRIGKLKLEVTVAGLRGIEVSGSSNVVCKDKLLAEKFEIGIAGSGGIKAELEAEKVTVDIAGSGDVKLSGSTACLSASIAGSGELMAGGLRAQSVSVDIAGSGDAEVCADKSLEASISGSGDVVYCGQVKNVKLHSAGSGSVRRLDG